MADGYDGGGVVAPPVSGLGNFKGVMLCNRPSDGPAAKPSGGDGPAPFKSMVSASHGDALGLPPCKGNEDINRGVKKRGPSAALRQHVRWLRELQEQMRGERELVEQEEKEGEAKKVRMRVAIDKHREAVRQMMEERAQASKESQGAMAAPAKPASKKVVKPLWAMTSKEKDAFEEDEADGLIDFAENLDYDKYVNDMEFRSGLAALKDRAGKLQKEQDAFKDALLKEFNSKAEEDDELQSTNVGSPRSLRLEDGIDGQSVFGDAKSEDKSEYSTCSRRSKTEERSQAQQEWDRSTACGDERPQVDREIKEAAKEVLDSAPSMRAIHSKESVQKIIQKTQQQQQLAPCDALVEVMRKDGAVPIPVITSSEDTQQRLHKAVDPSQLPYLYRSPAV